MESKVISREYVKKNYIHKEQVKKIIEKEIKTIKEEKEDCYYRENVIDVILKNILEQIMEETKDANK